MKATKAYTSGDLLIVNGTLYKANSGTLQLDADRAAVGADGAIGRHDSGRPPCRRAA